MKKFNISQRLSIIFIVFIILTIIILFLSLKLVSGSILGDFFKSDLKMKTEVLVKNFTSNKEHALNSVKYLQKSARLRRGVKSGNRKQILDASLDAMNTLQLDYLVVTDKNGKVIIRAHDPEKYGDSIIKQENISKALNGEASVGIEEGTVVKLSIRAGAPLRDEGGNIIGAISAGCILSNDKFVDSQKQLLGCEVTVFGGIERIATTLIRDGKRLTGTKLEHPVIIDSVIKNSKPYFGEATILGKFYFTSYTPIIGVSGKPAGILFIGKESEIISSLSGSILKYLSVILLIIGGLFMAATIYSIRLLLTSRLKKLGDFFIELADGKGDLTKRMDDSNDDEIGKPLQQFNLFLGSLKEIITVVQDNSIQLAESSEEITKATGNFSSNSQSQAAATEQITATIEEVAAGMDNIAASARFQHEKIDILINKINQLTSIIKDNSKNIMDTVNLANRIEGKAHEGEQSLKDMNLNMSRITDSSSDMLSIVGIINDISEQINLLSLNAAIEAARAGDSGRGFAVVADEISKLADQTASSIKEIDSLIKSSNEEISKGMVNIVNSIEIISSMIEGVEEIKNMIDRVYETTSHQIETNKQVTDEAALVKSRAEEISLATEEHKSGVGEIVRSVSNVNELTQSIAAGSEELTSNSEEIAAMAETLRARVGYFKVK